MTMWYSSMNPGLWPANRQSIPRTKATMAQAIGNRAVMRIVAVDAKPERFWSSCAKLIGLWLMVGVGRG